MGLGTKLAIFGRRLKDASLRRMNQNIQAIHQERGQFPINGRRGETTFLVQHLLPMSPQPMWQEVVTTAVILQIQSMAWYILR